MRDGQAVKLVAAYDFLEREGLADVLGTGAAGSGYSEAGSKVDVGQIALATALSWIEFRGLAPFKNGRPRLSAWYQAFVERPSMQATPPVGETHD